MNVVCFTSKPTTITPVVNVWFPYCSFAVCFYDPSRTFLPPLFRILNDFLSTHVPRAWRFNGCSRAHLNLSVDIGNYFADPQWLIVALWTRVLPAKYSRDFATLISQARLDTHHPRFYDPFQPPSPILPLENFTVSYWNLCGKLKLKTLPYPIECQALISHKLCVYQLFI